MIDNEIKQLAAEFANAVNGTKVKVYDNDGDLWIFKKEDILDIRTIPNKHNIVYIVLPTNAGTVVVTDKDGNFKIEPGTLLRVTGTPAKWKKLLNFNVAAVNETID